jgi:hypothetical protein
MTRLLLFLILSTLCLAADPNDMKQLHDLAHNWIKPVVPVKNVFRFEGITPFIWAFPQADGLVFQIVCTPATSCIVTGTTYRPVNLAEFNRLAAVWKGEPNLPTDPNLADLLSGVTDPNEVN